MSINYIKENLKKLDHDNLISFLFDVIVRGGIDDVEDFDETKEYVENEKICQKSFQHKKCYKCGKVLSKKPVFCLFQAVFQKNQVFFSTFSTIFLLKTCVCSICADCTNVRFLPFFYFKNVN